MKAGERIELLLYRSFHLTKFGFYMLADLVICENLYSTLDFYRIYASVSSPPMGENKRGGCTSGITTYVIQTMLSQLPLLHAF